MAGPATSTANAVGASITGGAVVLFRACIWPVGASILFAAVIGSLWSVRSRRQTTRCTPACISHVPLQRPAC